MTVPPYAVAASVLMTACYTSDRIQSRGPLIVSGCMLGGIGYMSVDNTVCSGLLLTPHVNRMLLVVAQPHVHIRYLATFCIAAGTYASLGLILAWCKYPKLVAAWGRETNDTVLIHLLVTHNLGSETKRATGMPLFGAIGQVGSILGSHLYPLTEGPAYSCVRAPAPLTCFPRSY